ncbi:MAG TPA: heavy metal-binding domain-containing protein [Tepidisphaeraceae bacterium]|jgi:hypothetical protein
MKTHYAVAALAALIAGCARPTPLVLALDHPAHPDAPQAPVAVPSQTLSLEPATAPATRPSVAYVCPMHPEVTSDRAIACPKCGMRLVEKGAN